MPAKIIQRSKKSFRKVKVDSVAIDIIESALRNARFEMDTVLFRTAMSPGIREQHDEFPMIANPAGQYGHGCRRIRMSRCVRRRSSAPMLARTCLSVLPSLAACAA